MYVDNIGVNVPGLVSSWEGPIVPTQLEMMNDKVLNSTSR